MERIVVVLDDARAGAEAARIVRDATGASWATIVSRIRARQPVVEAHLLGNDHDPQAARLIGALDALTAAGFATTLFDVDIGVPFDIMPDAWRAQCRLPRHVLDNRLAARETEGHRVAMSSEVERFAPEDPPFETVPIEVMLGDGGVATLTAKVATLPPWQLCLAMGAGADGSASVGMGSVAFAALATRLPLEVSGADLFEALTRARMALEPLNVRLLCQGARRDVHPSPIARQMGGRLAYVIRLGQPARREDLVDVLGPLADGDRVRVGTVAEQAERARRWAASIAALPS